MRIWIVHQHAIPPTQMGPTRHFELAKYLRTKGHDVTIISSNFCHNSYQYIAEPFCKTKQADVIQGVSFIWVSVPNYQSNSLKRLWNMAVFALQILKKKYWSSLTRPDVIIGSSPSPFAALSARLLAKKLNVPFIYEVRDLWPETLIALGKLSRKNPFVILLSLIESVLLKTSAHICSVLPGAVDYMMNKSIPKAKITWLPNFVDLDKIPKMEFKESNPPLKIIYSGSFNVANDLDTLVQAAKILQQQGWQDQIKIQLIGDGPAKKRLQTFVLENQISLVEFLEPLQKKDIYQFLLQADIFIAMIKNVGLYRWGTSLNKVADYMACGKPVLFAFNSPYNPISEAQAGLTVAPENPLLLAEGIKELVNMSKEKRLELGTNARRYIEQYQSLQGVGLRLENCLKKAMSGS